MNRTKKLLTAIAYTALSAITPANADIPQDNWRLDERARKLFLQHFDVPQEWDALVHTGNWAYNPQINAAGIWDDQGNNIYASIPLPQDSNPVRNFEKTMEVILEEGQEQYKQGEKQKPPAKTYTYQEQGPQLQPPPWGQKMTEIQPLELSKENISQIVHNTMKEYQINDYDFHMTYKTVNIVQQTGNTNIYIKNNKGKVVINEEELHFTDDN